MGNPGLQIQQPLIDKYELMQYQQESGVQAHKSIDEVWRGYMTSSSLDRGLPKLKKVTAKLVEQKYIQLEKELASVSRDILRRFPLDDCLSDLESDRRREILLNFRRTRSQRHVFEKMVSQYGDRTVRLYLKLVLCGFIRSSLGRLSPESIPGEIADLYHQWFEAILGEFSTRPNSRYDYRSVSLGVDMRICSLTDIPVGGAWIAETRRITLRPILKGGIRQFLGYPAFAIFKCGGFAPYYMFHTARRYLRYFNEKEMNLAYLRIAEMMKLNRNIKGLHNHSWFLDPQLEQISPHLTYLRQVPLQNGAKLFVRGSLESDVQNALILSDKRQQLHKQGKYIPTTYAVVWPREEFLSWADKAYAEIHASHGPPISQVLQREGDEPGLSENRRDDEAEPKHKGSPQPQLVS